MAIRYEHEKSVLAPHTKCIRVWCIGENNDLSKTDGDSDKFETRVCCSRVMVNCFIQRFLLLLLSINVP